MSHPEGNTMPDTDTTLRDVTDAADQLDAARDKRDHTVAAAVEQGLPVTHVATAARLTRQAVYDIVSRTTAG